MKKIFAGSVYVGQQNIHKRVTVKDIYYYIRIYYTYHQYHEKEMFFLICGNRSD